MDLSFELSRFSNFAGTNNAFCEISLVGPSILHLKNKSSKSSITMGFMALVHGNEYLGLPILNNLIEQIIFGDQKISSDIYFGLGNIPAAHANKRFLDEDLNRCFGKSDDKSQEAQRARELETLMLDHCDFLVDIHQTISAANDPFFIFQYTSERCLAIMEKWNPGIPVILQDDQLGLNTGLCADEYVRSQGKFGAALELGQLGTSEHFDLGLDICKRALDTTTEDLKKPHGISKKLHFKTLKLAGSFKVKDSSYKLDEGWKNLKSFEKGEKLGTHDGGVVEAPVAGFMLFPRYRALSEGQELFHYCTSI